MVRDHWPVILFLAIPFGCFALVALSALAGALHGTYLGLRGGLRYRNSRRETP